MSIKDNKLKSRYIIGIGMQSIDLQRKKIISCFILLFNSLFAVFILVLFNG